MVEQKFELCLLREFLRIGKTIKTDVVARMQELQECSIICAAIIIEKVGDRTIDDLDVCFDVPKKLRATITTSTTSIDIVFNF